MLIHEFYLADLQVCDFQSCFRPTIARPLQALEKAGLFQVLFLQDVRAGLEDALDVLRIDGTGKIWNTKLSAQRLLLGFLVSRLDLLMKLIFILERVVVDIGESIVVGIVSDDVAGAHGSIVADSAC